MSLVEAHVLITKIALLLACALISAGSGAATTYLMLGELGLSAFFFLLSIIAAAAIVALIPWPRR